MKNDKIIPPGKSRRTDKTIDYYIKEGGKKGAMIGIPALILSWYISMETETTFVLDDLLYPGEFVNEPDRTDYWMNGVLAGGVGTFAGYLVGKAIGAGLYVAIERVAKPAYRSLEKLINGD